MVPALTARMWGREEIEWKDRSWRLLENEGQVLCDDWSVGGTVLGGVVMALRERGSSAAGKGVRLVGGAAAGNVVGILGYMVYQYGYRGKKME